MVYVIVFRLTGSTSSNFFRCLLLSAKAQANFICVLTVSLKNGNIFILAFTNDPDL